MGHPVRKSYVRLDLAEKAKAAAEMMREGVQLKDIAKALGYKGPSGPAMLIRRAIRELPRQALEDLQKELLADLDVVHNLAMKDVDHRDPDVRDKAQKRIISVVEKKARISGIIKAPPPVVVMNNGPQQVDLSVLSIEQIEALKGIQTKLLEAPIVAQGESVNEQRTEELEQLEQRQDERILDVGPEGSPGERA